MARGRTEALAQTRGYRGNGLRRRGVWAQLPEAQTPCSTARPGPDTVLYPATLLSRMAEDSASRTVFLKTSGSSSLAISNGTVTGVTSSEASYAASTVVLAAGAGVNELCTPLPQPSPVTQAVGATRPGNRAASPLRLQPGWSGSTGRVTRLGRRPMPAAGPIVGYLTRDRRTRPALYTLT
jgi:glycine/D-amino acid oxidase-like deaminating enzyme